MRQVAGDAKHEIVVFGRHGLHIGAEQPPERRQPFHRGRIDVRRRGEDAPAIDEQLGEARIRPGVLGACNRMRRHEMHTCGNMG